MESPTINSADMRRTAASLRDTLLAAAGEFDAIVKTIDASPVTGAVTDPALLRRMADALASAYELLSDIPLTPLPPSQQRTVH